jgi:glycosyltransferase involved in cell wall biosynthesis
MRILFVADVSIQRVIGGAERVLFEQSVRLARRGHEIHILTRRPPGDDRAQFVTQQVTEHRYIVDTRNPISFLCSTLKNSRRLFESMHAATAFDCIHFHQPFSAAGVLMSRRVRQIPKLYSSHSLSFEEFISRNPQPVGFAARTIYRANVLFRKHLERRVLRGCNTIVVLSRFSQQRLHDAHGILPGKTELIHGAVDIDKFRPASDKIAIRQRLHLPADRVIIFTVRNLVARMGLENLLLAIKELSRRAPDLFLIVGGEGPLGSVLRDLVHRENIADHVRFAGFIPEEELPSYYQMADLFVLPTRELEGFGLVTLESLASGVPVVGTPVGGTVEILGQFDPKFIFKDTTPSSMAALIWDCYQEIIKSPLRWEDVLMRCRQFVEKNYSWEASVDALENLYRRLSRPAVAGERKKCSASKQARSSSNA